MKKIVMMMVLGMGAMVVGMSTEKEIAKAEPLVMELMRDDLNAVRANTKTREQVGEIKSNLEVDKARFAK